MKRVLIFLIIIVSTTILIVTVVRASIYNPEQEVAPSTQQKDTIQNKLSSSDYPSYLVIPTLNIKAKVEEVGITNKGNVATPDNFVDVGWYKYGPLPGSVGTSIIDGHVDNGFALPGVFSDLKNIKIGDSIYIKTKDEKTLPFVVKNLSIYSYDNKVDQIISNANNKSYLVLITCSGNWISSLKTHNERLVVTAVLEK